jgi:subtilisin family serine protease
MFGQRGSLALRLFACFAIVGGLGLAISAQGRGQGPPDDVIPPQLRERIQSDGFARVIAELRLPSPFVAEGRIGDAGAILRQRQAIAAARGRVLSNLGPAGARLLRQYETVPYVALEFPAAALPFVAAASGDLVRVMEDVLIQPSLASSVPLIQGDQAWQSGYDGSGTAVAVLDSGVDAGHPFFGGRVVAEACFSSTVKRKTVSMCPNGQETQIGPGAAAPCDWTAGCEHGTHVTGIAAGSGDAIGQPFSGVARNASIMGVQVFSEVIDRKQCGGAAPCLGAFTSDVIAGLEHVYATVVGGQLDVAAVNMSLGAGAFDAPCDAEPYKPAIDNLRAVGVASVVASGNAGETTRISSPACISSAISVGSTSLADDVSWFSNVAPFLSLLAPGDAVTSSTPGGGFTILGGTSMAAPHVTGAWAVIRQGAPGASVDDVLAALHSTGVPITDTRFWGPGTTTVPRVRILQALAELAPITSPAPEITGVSPATARAGLDLTLTVTGSGFNVLSVVQWNGVPADTTVVSTRELRAVVSGAQIAIGAAEVTVSNPAPGGGTSAPLTVEVLPPAVLTVSADVVAPGNAVTVTLENGYGGALDWLVLAEVGAPNESFVTWGYIGEGKITTAWTVTMPSSPGQYEFRLFLDNGFFRAATSPPVTVDSAVSPVPSLTSLDPARGAVGGPDLTLTVVGAGFVAASIVRANGADRATEFVSGTQLRALIPAADLAVPGNIEITVFTPPPGGGTSAPLILPVVVPPVLSVSETIVAPGASITVTLTNAPGGALDWLALAATDAPNDVFLLWSWVGAGVTTRTWDVTMPTTPGTYEFRLFLDNGFVRAATSPVVTVGTPPPGGGSPPGLTVSETSVETGASVTTTLTDGPGNAGDWLALAAVGSPDASYLQSTLVGAGVTDRTWTVTMPATAGTYEFRLFLETGERAATSPAVTVTEPPPPGGGSTATLTVSETTVEAGASVTATLLDGPGGALDWLALAVAGAPDGSYLQWTYVGDGVTTRTWTVPAPLAEGDYEFRLFLNNGLTRAATSPAFTVVPSSSPPSLDVSTMSAAPGESVTVTLTNGLGGALDWLAFAAVGAPDTSFLQWGYIGEGVTTTTWTVTMPSTPGQYEFRLFPNNGYTRAATSPPVTVAVTVQGAREPGSRLP